MGRFDHLIPARRLGWFDHLIPPGAGNAGGSTRLLSDAEFFAGPSGRLGWFGDLIPHGPTPAPMTEAPVPPMMPDPVPAPPSLADALMQALAPQPAMPIVTPEFSPANPGNPPITAPGWMDDRFGPGQIVDMAAPVAPMQGPPMAPSLIPPLPMPVGPMGEAIRLSTPVGGGMTPEPIDAAPAPPTSLADAILFALDPFGTTRELGKGIVSGGAGTIGAGAKTLGFDETAQSMGEFSRRPGLEPAVPDWTDIGSPLDAAQYAAGLTGQSAPEMAAIIASMAGGTAVGGPVAGVGTGMATSTLFHTGRNLQRQEAENPDDETSFSRAITTGIVQSGLDQIVPGRLLGNFGTRLLGAAGEKGLVRAGKEVGLDTLTEGVTETLQQTAEIWQADPELLRIMTDPQTPEEVERSDRLIAEMVSSFVGGGTVGGGLSAGRQIVTAPAPVIQQPAGPTGETEQAQQAPDLASALEQYQPPRPAQPSSVADLIPQPPDDTASVQQTQPAAPALPASDAPPAVTSPAVEAPTVEPVGRAADGVVMLDPSSVLSDPERFQFKSGGDEEGVTDQLRGVRQWSDEGSGIAIVWEDVEGRRFIVDGHQRLALAKRLQAEGENPLLRAIVLREADGVTAEAAMFRGAMKNLQEGGEGTSALDVARVFRRGGTPEVVRAQMPPRRRAYRDGLALAQLGDTAFGMVVNGMVAPNHAAEVGRQIEGDAAQAAALKYLAQYGPTSADEARILVGQLNAAGFQPGREQSLFGEGEVAAPLLSQRTRILDSTTRHLRKLSQAFRTAIDSEAILAGVGNVLDPEANASGLSDNQRLALAIERLAQRKGPISDALNEQARRVASGDATLAEARDAFLEAVRSLDAPGGFGGDGVRRPGRADGEGGGDRQVRQEPARSGTQEGGSVDLTPEGRQLVIPGAEQSTDRERAKRQLAQPKRGGNTPAGGLFDEDAQAQGMLFEAKGIGEDQRARQARTTDESPASAPSVPGMRDLDAPKARSDRGSGRAKEAEDTTGTRRRPGGRLSPRFLDFSFTNRTSVFGAAFRAAGVDPDEGRTLPIERQLGIASRALTERFGVEVQLPAYKVRRKNLVGRIVSTSRPQITTREALDQLLDAFRQLQMLASIMGVPEKAMALEIAGKPIVLSLVSTKRFGSLGSFSVRGTSERIITLPGRSNSWAHEWGHALDHYLGDALKRQDAKVFLSRQMDDPGVQRPLSPRAALADAFAGIMQSLFGDKAQMNALMLRLQVEATQVGADGKPTPNAKKARDIMAGIRAGKRPPAAYLSAYFKSSAEYDRMSGAGDYFKDPAEMFARAFEAWVGRTVSTISDLPQGFLSKSAWGYDEQNDPRLTMTFPKDADAAAFAVAMLDLSHAMARTALFGPDAPAAKPEDVDIYSPNALMKRLPRTSIPRQEAEGWRTTANAVRTARSDVAHAVSSAATTANRVGLLAFRSTVGALQAVAARQRSPEARRAIENVADLIGTRPGSGRFLGNVYQTDVEMKARQLDRMVDGALAQDFHGRRLTREETARLRSMLVEDGDPNGPPPLKRLASNLRTVLDTAWYQLKNAGVEVGYASKYLPRITLVEKVDKAPDRFKAQAAKVYALMFQREVTENEDQDAQHADIKTVAGELRSARMPTPAGETEPTSRLNDQDEEVYQTYLAARQKLRALQKEAEADPLNTTIGDRIAEAESEFERLRKSVLDMLQDRFATYAAENWYVSAKVGRLNDFDVLGPTSSFLHGRKLPPETDTLMAEFMEADPIDLIRGYVYSAVRRAEYARRFGARNEKLEAMLRAAASAGATTEATDLAKQAVLAATGRVGDRYPPLRGVRSAAFFWGNLVLLPFSAFTSIAEPIATGLRSGYTRDSLKAIVSNLRLAVQRGRREDLYELARIIGLVNNALRDGYMENRTNADSVGMGRTMNRLLARFYQLNLLSPLTNFQRVATVPVAQAIIMRHLRKAAGGARFADRELNELGIAQEDRADLLQWLEGLQGVPSPDDLLAPDGGFYNRAAELWASAVVRLTDTVIQNPMKSDRPIFANDPAYAPLYGIMSYLISFQRNIINRTFLRGVGDRETFMGKGGQVGVNLLNAAAPVTLLFAGHVLSTILREFLLNQEVWQKKEDDDELLEWLLARALSRTGLAGVLEPPARALVGLAYEKDIANFLVGPYGSAWLKNAEAILNVASWRNSPNTNTAERAAAEAAYALIVQPVLLAAITHAAPAGPLSSIALGTLPLWLASRRGTREGFADMLAGPEED